MYLYMYVLIYICFALLNTLIIKAGTKRPLMFESTLFHFEIGDLIADPDLVFANHIVLRIT